MSCAALLVCLCAAAPATSLTFAFSGYVESIRDDLGALDASVDLPPAPGQVPVSGTYQVDLTTSSTTTPFAVGAAQLSFSVGNYSFSAGEGPHAIALINDRPVLSTTIDLWQSHEISLGDLAPATDNHGIDFAGFAAQIEFNDFSSSVFDGSEAAPFVPDGVAGWDQVVLRLTRLTPSGGGPPVFDNHVQVGMNLTSWALVPEPRTDTLLVFGLTVLALRRRRRARTH